VSQLSLGWNTLPRAAAPNFSGSAAPAASVAYRPRRSSADLAVAVAELDAAFAADTHLAALRRSSGGAHVPMPGSPPRQLPPPVAPRSARSTYGDAHAEPPPSALRALAQHELPPPPSSDTARARIAAAREVVLRAAAAPHAAAAPSGVARAAPVRAAAQRAMDDMLSAAAGASRLKV
jgi:hypothetical protein